MLHLRMDGPNVTLRFQNFLLGVDELAAAHTKFLNTAFLST